MDFLLSDDHGAIQELVRDFARNEIAPVAEELDREKRFPYEIVGKLGELGLMGIPFAEEHGGGGGDTLAYALAVEELARVDSSVAITLCAHTSLAPSRSRCSAATNSASAGCRTCAAAASSAPSG